jgi:hypothetical protein
MMLEQSAQVVKYAHLYRRLEMLEPEGAEAIRPKRRNA